MKKIIALLLVFLMLFSALPVSAEGEDPVSTAEPVADPTAEPVADPATEPTAEPAAEPVTEPDGELAADEPFYVSGMAAAPDYPDDPLLEDDGVAEEDAHLMPEELYDDAPALEYSEDAAGFALLPESASGADYTYARVLLSTGHEQASITVQGNYSVTSASGDTVAIVYPGAAYTLSKGEGSVLIKIGSTVLYEGESFTIQEHTPNEGGSNYISVPHSSKGTLNYKGSLNVVYTTVGSTTGMFLINKVYIEDYLKGVIGNEIGDSSGAAALEAQAVVARNYAITYIASRASKLYDLLDTSANQVYTGAPGDQPNSALAVDAVSKKVLTSAGSIIGTYYSASNGGEIEIPAHRWSQVARDYENVKSDPYDLAYIAGRDSYFEAYTVNKTNPTGTLASALIDTSLLPALKSAGYAVSTSADITLSSIALSTSPLAGHTFGGVGCTMIGTLHAVYTGTAAGQAFEISADVAFPNTLGIFTNSNLSCYWLSENSTGYSLRHARRGHGIGLSQVGARQMCINGSTSDEILQFYYGGAAVTTQLEACANIGTPTLTAMPESISYELTSVSGAELYEQAITTATVLINVPAGTLVTVTGVAGEFYQVTALGQSGYMLMSAFTAKYEYIRIGNVITSCNIRSGPGTNYTKLGTANLNDVYKLLSSDMTAAWYKIQYTASTVGYVSSAYAIPVTRVEAGVALPVKSVSVSPVRLSLVTGEIAALEAAVLPVDADDLTVTWSSSNTAVVTVDASTGEVTASGRGSATVYCTANDGSGQKGSCAVTVTQPVESITLNETERTLTQGQYIQLTATVLPQNANNRGVTWSSSDTAVATVSGGRVTAKAGGVCTVYAVAADGCGANASCTVTVVPRVSAVTILDAAGDPVGATYGVDINTNSAGSTIAFSTEVTPVGASPSMTWKSSNARVATVDSAGIVTVMGVAGTSYISATAADGSGRSARFTLNVTILVNNVTVSSANGSTDVAERKTLRLTADILPANAQNKRVTWSSDNVGIATVTSAGIVTGKSAGTATITATAADGSGETGTFDVTVKPAVMTVTILDADNNHVGATCGVDINANPAGSTIAFSAEVTPVGASPSMTWKSSNARVATVDSTGVVTVMGVAGTSYISATAADGSGRSARFTLNVTVLVTGITVSSVNGSADVAERKTLRLTADILPVNAKNKRVTWSSSDTDTATVTSAGIVTGKSVGTATITALAADGSGITGSFDVTVKPAATAVIMTYGGNTVTSRDTLALEMTDTTGIQLTAAVAPAEAGQGIAWKSSNTRIATVDETGKVTAVSGARAGVVTITATATDGTNKSTSVRVNVAALSTKILFTSAPDSIATGKSVQLTAIASNADDTAGNTATNKTVTWETAYVSWTPDSEGTAPRITAAGRVTAGTATGTVTFRVNSRDGRSTATHTIAIKPAATAVTMTYGGNTVTNRQTVTVSRADGTVTLNSLITPDTAGQGVTWKTSNAAIASVTPNADGSCEAALNKAGTVMITCTASDGSGKSMYIYLKITG